MTTGSRRIDHLVLAVHDLERAASFYRRLGFQVGARNRHPWGTENHVIQFAASFLELITVADVQRVPPHAPRSFSFGQFVRDYLARREGLAMFVLDSADARADAAAFARAGIGDYEPFSFERAGRAADGTETHVAFTLAFATDDSLPDAGFFVCQQHHPEAFWSAALQRHENGATNVSGVDLRVARPQDHVRFLEAFIGAQSSGNGLEYRFDQAGRLELDAAADRVGFTGFTVAALDLDVVARRLSAQDLPFQQFAGRLVLAPDQCFGVEITFESTVA